MYFWYIKDKTLHTGDMDSFQVSGDWRVAQHQNYLKIQNKLNGHVSCIMCHLSPVTCHRSFVTCHLSPITCYMSHTTVPCHLSTFTLIYTASAAMKVWAAWFCPFLFWQFKKRTWLLDVSSPLQ